MEKAVEDVAALIRSIAATGKALIMGVHLGGNHRKGFRKSANDLESKLII